MDSAGNDLLESFLETHEPIKPDSSFSPGDTLGDWRLTAYIGKGGSGEVYRAESVASNAVAAVKVYIPRTGENKARDASAKERFVREAKFLAENPHPYFPRFMGGGERDGRPWYAMEFLEDRNLPSQDAEVADFILRISEAVRHLHSLGLVHRDIKPGNILWRPVGRDASVAPSASAEPVLVDFGLLKDASGARPGQDRSLSFVDGKAVVVGTPRYAAPEQLNGGGVTQATDVYALGMLANECFGGKPPRSWERIIRRATAALPAHRYATVDEFANAIRSRCSRRNFIALLAALVIAAGVGFAVYGWLFGRGASRREDGAKADGLVAAVAHDGKCEWTSLAHTMVSNGVMHSTLRLDSRCREVAGTTVLNGPQVVTIEGPGSIEADVEGPSYVTIRLRNCEFRNTARSAAPDNAIQYELEGDDVDLVFPNMYYPTNCVRGALVTGPNFTSDPPGAKMLFRR